MEYNYPLKLNFKLIALAPKISIKDANDTEILYVEQKVLALKEAVKVFDSEQSKNLLYTMQANQMIDFGATYTFTNVKNNKVIGSLQQEGMRSLFQASYSVQDDKGQVVYKITQSNPLVAILDALINIIPFAELITGFILNPQYTVTKIGQTEPLIIMKKKPSFFESNFTITKTGIDGDKKDALLILLSLLMTVQLEKNRG